MHRVNMTAGERGTSALCSTKPRAAESTLIMRERAAASRSRRGPHLIDVLAANPCKLMLQTGGVG
jgi:hypothetical protein